MGILVVDHEPYRSQSLARGLRIMGYTVFHAVSLSGALEFMKAPSIPISLIIADSSNRILHHPEMIQAIQEEIPHIHLLVLVHDAENYANAAPPSLRPTRFLTKPFQVEQLAQLIEELGTPR